MHADRCLWACPQCALPERHEDLNAPYAPGPAAPRYAPAPAPPAKENNTIGLIGFIAAVVGFIFACIPFALIVGWILLPTAFILSIVALCLKDKKKGFGLAGLIISIIGTIIGFIVFIAVVATAVGGAFSDDTSVSAPVEKPTSADDALEAEEADEKGTRTNPHPLGSTVSTDEWTVKVNSVNLNANKAIASENEFNEPASKGEVYILANVTIKYTGTNPDGAMPFEIIEYVTASGTTVDSYDTLVVAPDELDSTTTLYEGASITGNIAFSVPADSADEGVLAVAPGLFGDKVFVAVK